MQISVVPGENTRDVAFHVTKGVPVEVTAFYQKPMFTGSFADFALDGLTAPAADDQKPVAGVPVPTGGVVAYTDENGRALVRLSPGTKHLFVTKQSSKYGWPLEMTNLEVEPGRTYHLRIEIVPPIKIAGIVRDASGMPVTGADVSFLAGNPHPEAANPDRFQDAETRTDDRGRYEMALEEDTSFSVSGAPNYILARSVERNLAAIEEFKNIPAKLDLVLQPGMTLTGVVEDADGGAPIASAKVQMKIGSELRSQPIVVDAGGSFAVSALPQGCEYKFDFSASYYGAAQRTLTAEDTKTNRYEFLPILLNRAEFKVGGVVLGPDGNPLPGAQIRLSGAGQKEGLGVTADSAGRFLFDNVCKGEVQVFANWSGRGPGGQINLSTGRTIIKAQAGNASLVIQLHDSGL